MGTPYKSLYDGLLSKIKSLGLPGITEEQSDELMFDYIRPACVKFKACKQDLNDRNDSVGTFNIDFTDEEFEILVIFMLIEYLSANYINVPLLLRQTLTSKDFHVFSSRNHLDGLVNLKDNYVREVGQMVSAYSHSDSRLFDILREKRLFEPAVGP